MKQATQQHLRPLTSWICYVLMIAVCFLPALQWFFPEFLKPLSTTDDSYVHIRSVLELPWSTIAGFAFYQLARYYELQPSAQEFTFRAILRLRKAGALFICSAALFFFCRVGTRLILADSVGFWSLVIRPFTVSLYISGFGLMLRSFAKTLQVATVIKEENEGFI